MQRNLCIENSSSGAFTHNDIARLKSIEQTDSFHSFGSQKVSYAWFLLLSIKRKMKHERNTANLIPYQSLS